jgi:hypothetical protein
LGELSICRGTFVLAPFDYGHLKASRSTPGTRPKALFAERRTDILPQSVTPDLLS